ncbi:MAG: alpha-N-arabinofuranosidase, partial [Bryobacteraceae bacterium]
MLTRRSFSTALLATPWAASGQRTQLLARVKIDTERVISDIDQKIYGNFAEHLGRCIDGGIFEEKSPLSDSEGYRKDVLEAAKQLNVTLLRWPGGN